MSEASAAQLVTEFRREARRVQKDIRQARESRMIALKQDLEDKLFEMGFELGSGSISQIDVVLDELLPRPDAVSSLQALAPPDGIHVSTNSSVTININPKFFSAMEQYVAENVNGDFNLGSEAKQLLALIREMGGPASQPISTAIRELEDPDTPAAGRKAAVTKLKRFLVDLGGKAEDAALTFLEKYLESKIGL
jgi:hypothetical protein